jgi:hypothetical protein
MDAPLLHLRSRRHPHECTGNSEVCCIAICCLKSRDFGPRLALTRDVTEQTNWEMAQ